MDLPIKVKGNLKCSCGNLLSLLGAQTRISAQALLTEVKRCIILILHLNFYTFLLFPTEPVKGSPSAGAVVGPVIAVLLLVAVIAAVIFWRR